MQGQREILQKEDTRRDHDDSCKDLFGKFLFNYISVLVSNSSLYIIYIS